MHAHHGISRRHVLGLAVACSGLALDGNVRSVGAQATGGGGKVSLDVRHPDLHTLIAPETPSCALRAAWSLPKGRCGGGPPYCSAIFPTGGSCAGAACRRARSSPPMRRGSPM